jgi:hypothetical protein
VIFTIIDFLNVIYCINGAKATYVILERISVYYFPFFKMEVKGRGQ